MEDTKSKYLQNPLPPVSRKALVVGYSEDNIGGEISRRLEADGLEVYSAEEEELPASSLSSFKRLPEYDTIIFNNGRTHLDWIEKQDERQIDEVVYNSLTSSMTGTADFVGATKDKPYQKNIVYIGSMAYRNVLNGSAPYCAAKAGLAMFARCMAWELAPKNYNVFCVHPSNTEHAPMSAETVRGLMRYRSLNREDAEAYWGASLPRSAWLQKQDIASVVSYLVSGDSGASYLSGSNIELGGGQR